MKRARRLVLFVLALGAPLAASAQAGSVPDCVEVQANARWAASSYNHIVHIENGCGQTARCSVATNVNPDAQSVRVPAGQSTDVLTFRGSPAREFTPVVSCVLGD